MTGIMIVRPASSCTCSKFAECYGVSCRILDPRFILNSYLEYFQPPKLYEHLGSLETSESVGCTGNKDYCLSSNS
jgi:hypothetical protein